MMEEGWERMRGKKKILPDMAEGEKIRWCESHQYFIDHDACLARSRRNPSCRRCLSKSHTQQLSLPFMNQ
jgi:hypothetical protein